MTNPDFPAQLRELAANAKRKHQSHTPLLHAADLIDHLLQTNLLYAARIEHQRTHPYWPAADLAQARSCARYFPCPATGCTANQWDPCNTVSLQDHDERVTWWLSNGRPTGSA